jgi:hypothetical protein
MSSEKMVAVVSNVNLSLVLGDHPILEAQSQVPGIEVHFADGGSVIPIRAEGFTPNTDTHRQVIGPQKLAVVEHAVLDSIYPHQERHSCRHTE